jgi:PAS domain-containing protein
MAAQQQQQREPRSGHVVQARREVAPHISWRPRIPGGLLSRACHTLPWGILIVSAQGTIDFYNRAYAQLRGIAPGALLGQPVALLDRRHRLRNLLRAGTLAPECTVPDERRQNREIILPVWEDDWSLIGVVVVVARAAEWPGIVREHPFEQVLAPRMARKASPLGADQDMGAGPRNRPGRSYHVASGQELHLD